MFIWCLHRSSEDEQGCVKSHHVPFLCIICSFLWIVGISWTVVAPRGRLNKTAQRWGVQTFNHCHFFSETFPRATRAYCTNREIFQRVMWALSLHSSCFFFLSFFLSTSSLPAEEQCESRPVQWRRPHRLTSGETDTLARNRDSLKSQARVRRKVSDNNLLQRYRMILDKLFQKKGFVSRRK